MRLSPSFLIVTICLACFTPVQCFSDMNGNDMISLINSVRGGPEFYSNYLINNFLTRIQKEGNSYTIAGTDFHFFEVGNVRPANTFVRIKRLGQGFRYRMVASRVPHAQHSFRILKTLSEIPYLPKNIVFHKSLLVSPGVYEMPNTLFKVIEFLHKQAPVPKLEPLKGLMDEARTQAHEIVAQKKEGVLFSMTRPSRQKSAYKNLNRNSKGIPLDTKILLSLKRKCPRDVNTQTKAQTIGITNDSWQGSKMAVLKMLIQDVYSAEYSNEEPTFFSTDHNYLGVGIDDFDENLKNENKGGAMQHIKGQVASVLFMKINREKECVLKNLA